MPLYNIRILSPNARTYEGLIVAKDLDDAYAKGYSEVAPNVSGSLPVVGCELVEEPEDEAIAYARRHANLEHEHRQRRRWTTYLLHLECALAWH